MARAGFTVISTGKIRFTKNGRWYAGTEPIENRRVVALFNRSLRVTSDGRYELVIGRERVPVEVEDTPFVVIRVDGDPKRGFTVTLNDGTRERLDTRGLAVGPDRAFSCRVKGSVRARFLRPAHYQLGKHVEKHGGRYVLAVGGKRIPVSADTTGARGRRRQPK